MIATMGRRRLGAEARLSGRAKAPLAAVAAPPLLYAAAFGVINPILPLYAVSLGASAYLISLYTILGTAANVIARPISGRLSDKLGRPRLMAIGLACSGCAATLLAASRSSWQLVPLNVLIGFGAAVFWPSLKATAIERNGSHEVGLGTVVGAQEAGATLGQLAAGVVISVLTLRLGFVLGTALLVAAAVSVVVFLAIATAEGDGATSQRVARAAPAEPLPRRTLATSFLVMCLLGASISAFLPFLVLYLIKTLHSSGVVVGVTFALFSVARLLAGLAAPHSVRGLRRIAAPRLRIPLLLAVAVGLALSKSFTPLPLFIVAGALLAATLTTANVAIMARMTRLAGVRLAGRLGSLEAAGLSGALIGPSLGAVCFSLRPQSVFWLCAGLLAAAAVASLGLPQEIPGG